MRARLCVVAFPLVLLACKKEAPAPSTAPSAAAPGASAPAAATAAQVGKSLAILKDFEGQIEWAVKGKLAGPPKPGGAPLTLTLAMKGERFRFDMPAGMPGAPPGASAYVLGSPKEKKLHVVLDAQKQVLVLEPEKLAAQLAQLPGKGGAAAGAAPELKKTGRRDEVAGYSCEVWELVQSGSKSELCVAVESERVFDFPLADLPEQFAFAKELTDGKHFPLRFVTFDRKGAEEGRMELIGIEKKALDAKSFELPPGYQTVDLEQMMAGLMQQFGGAHGRPGLPSLKGLPFAPQALPSGLVPPATTAKPKPASSK